jgi:hypothetical protein
MIRKPVKRPRRKVVIKRPRQSLKSAVPPPPPPPPPDPSVQEMRERNMRIEARMRVAAFMERTTNQPWMRKRLGTFEQALLEGCRNLLDESVKDEAEGRCPESQTAHFVFLYGLLSSFRHLFFWAAFNARMAGAAVDKQPDEEDAEMILRELEVYNAASMRDDVQARFSKILTENRDVLKRVMEQAHSYDIFNAKNEPPKA